MKVQLPSGIQPCFHKRGCARLGSGDLVQCLGQAANVLGGDTSHGDAAVARHEDRMLLRQPVHLPHTVQSDLLPDYY